jgi:hypothetical protein
VATVDSGGFRGGNQKHGSSLKGDYVFAKMKPEKIKHIENRWIQVVSDTKNKAQDWKQYDDLAEAAGFDGRPEGVTSAIPGKRIAQPSIVIRSAAMWAA